MTTKTGYDALMHEICVGMGFCGCVKYGKPLHVDDFIPEDGPVKAEQFIEWVFLADDMNPNVDPQKWQPHKDKMKAAFIKFMGGDVVDASKLRWSKKDS